MDNEKLWDCEGIIIKKKGEDDKKKKGWAKVVKQEKIRPKFLNCKKNFDGIVKKPAGFRGVDGALSNFKVKARDNKRILKDTVKEKEWVLKKELAMEFSLVSMINYLKTTYKYD